MNISSTVLNKLSRCINDLWWKRPFLDNESFVQPTAKQMLRRWRAFMFVKDAQDPYPEQRTLTVF